ncbi:unnamed protein product [Dibothriocephalus latus]|uniref:Uncharacterized protein n=1 Tax=Dibothriocephalus latus TaxID=60516 RepID=A0A3P7PEM8_DIBLA|nr:unnamed protein product [Dibothriocephalus latus]
MAARDPYCGCCPVIAHVSPSGVESPTAAYRRRVGSSKDPLEATRYRPNPLILQLSRLLADKLKTALRLIVPGEVIEQTDASLLFNSDEVQCSSPDPARLPPLPDDERESPRFLRPPNTTFDTVYLQTLPP